MQGESVAFEFVIRQPFLVKPLYAFFDFWIGRGVDPGRFQEFQLQLWGQFAFAPSCQPSGENRCGLFGGESSEDVKRALLFANTAMFKTILQGHERQRRIQVRQQLAGATAQKRLLVS